MNKLWHEIRDPIHTFVRLDSEDRLVLDSTPFQRLRDIQQLSMSHFVYPGATHKRFEHSLGVMELASRAYDSLTQPHKIEQVRGLLDQLDSPEKVARWRRVVRMAALCHDMGHFPFSHASEHLLPAGWDHERMSRALIFSKEMQDIWQKGMDAPMRAEEIADLAVGPDPDSPEAFPAWKAVLKEIITSDVFGVDRMDYLLRDSHHTGVAYGRFDHHRLIDTLRFLPEAPTGDDGTDSEGAPTLGVEEGGLQSAEQLLLARYFMFSQVYLHRVRRIYDIHLSDFLTAMLRERGGHLPTDPAEHLAMSDVEVVSEMRLATTRTTLVMTRPGASCAANTSACSTRLSRPTGRSTPIPAERSTMAWSKSSAAVDPSDATDIHNVAHRRSSRSSLTGSPSRRPRYRTSCVRSLQPGRTASMSRRRSERKLRDGSRRR